MVRFSADDRKEIASKLMDVGNLIFAAVTFGQAFSNEYARIQIALLGIVFFFLFYLIAIVIRKGGSYE